MRPNIEHNMYIPTIWLILFAVDLIAVHGGLNLAYQLMLILLFGMGLLLTMSFTIIAFKEKTEGGDV